MCTRVCANRHCNDRDGRAAPKRDRGRGSKRDVRPARLRRTGTTALTAASLPILFACGRQALERVTSLPLEVVVAQPAYGSSDKTPVIPPTASEGEVEPLAGGPDAALADPGTLPKSWSGPIVPRLAFTDALRKARVARDGFTRLIAPAAQAKEPAIKAWFAQAQMQVDQASRMYAAAFHAPDAPREGRIDAIAEAAELDMTMARSLDDADLGAMPVGSRGREHVRGHRGWTDAPLA